MQAYAIDAFYDLEKAGECQCIPIIPMLTRTCTVEDLARVMDDGEQESKLRGSIHRYLGDAEVSSVAQ